MKGIKGMKDITKTRNRVEVNIADYQGLILRWTKRHEKELLKYGMEGTDFVQEIYIKWSEYKGHIDPEKTYQSKVTSLIQLVCYRYLIDLRRKHKENVTSLDAELKNGEDFTLADTIQDNVSFDLSLMLELQDSIPDRKCTKNFTYKQLFQMILDKGNEPLVLADIMDISTARVSQITSELIQYIKTA